MYFRNISVQVYDSKPYSTGATGPGDKVLKVTICGLSRALSVDDSAVFEMLDKFEVNRKSEIKYENIRLFLLLIKRYLGNSRVYVIHISNRARLRL